MIHSCIPKKNPVLRTGIHPTPFGYALFAFTENGICALRFVSEKSGALEFAELRSEWPEAIWVKDDKLAAKTAHQIFDEGVETPISLDLRGTPFQRRVWEALLLVPRGACTTYSQIAASIRHPSAARATGTAIGRNPVAFLIPCHRVIPRNGGLGNYRWGKERKGAILRWESQPPSRQTI